MYQHENLYNYPPTKWEGYSFGIVHASTLFVRPEPYLSTCWPDLMHFYSTLDKQRICVNTQLKSSKKQLK